MLACTNASIPLIELLIENDANINKENFNGMTPLHAACLSGNIKAVDILLDH
jgi:ankyrin repeat protein